MNIEMLDPVPVWRHFATLCRIPRVSKHEQVLREHLRQWALKRGLQAEVDGGGNLLIRKAATAGRERCLPLVLQGHIDMVCQKNPDVAHDFFRDPIETELADGWLVARDTTLGADNGIGVALALAVLESDTVSHGPLEVLLTVDEEAGMGGARTLAAGLLRAKLLINLDTEEWGRFYLGCAGGMDVVATTTYALEPLPADWALRRLAVGGLAGGHSGIDIHRGRGHAISLLLSALHDLSQESPYRLVALEGGTARNAIPRDAFADIAAPAHNLRRIEAWSAARQAALRAQLAVTDPSVTVTCGESPRPCDSAATPVDHHRLLDALRTAPQGVRRMSAHFAGVVETSDNLGVVRVANGDAEAVCMVRSLIDAEAQGLGDEIVALFAARDWSARATGAYPGWQPRPDSPLLKLCQDVYARTFDSTAGLEVIHAGLECGLIGARYPQLDMISFGPEIRGAHAPGEKVEVESVARTWKLLVSILAAVPEFL